MAMDSFVIKVARLFQISRGENPDFEPDRTKYVIPKYQREYTWTEEKVKTLFSDINNSAKFIGILILNKVPGGYEIVDGQQRITTILLMLVALFNKTKLLTGNDLSEEQKELKRYLYKNGHLVLENESVGEYIHLEGNELSLCIDAAADIYYQRDTFEKIYGVIAEELEAVDLLQFQRKLLACKVLVLLGDPEDLHDESIEEVFLDINFKTQLLDVADIFKGYCFKNYAATCHEELKEQWTVIRKYIKEFEKIGYGNKDTCDYIYHYLLSRPETEKIPANLSPGGKHYLEGKNHTQTKALLVDMGSYGKNITDFVEKLSQTTYLFDDICSNAVNYRTDVVNHQTIKKMLRSIILNTNAQYYKLPLFMVVHYILKNEALKNAFSYESFKKFVTNYYVYSLLFLCEKKYKNKTAINHTIFNELYQLDSGRPATEVISRILTATKALRCDYVEKYQQFETFSLEKAEALYSVIDQYSSPDNYLKLVYSYPDYNREHLIAHSNTLMAVTWEEEENRFAFSLRDLLGKASEKTYVATAYRSSTANYIILPSGLNGDLGQEDIVKKTADIRAYYVRRRENIPTHIEVFLTHIEEMPEYQVLSNMKGQKQTQDEIKFAYKNFATAYFRTEQQRVLYTKIETAFKNSFANRT